MESSDTRKFLCLLHWVLFIKIAKMGQSIACCFFIFWLNIIFPAFCYELKQNNSLNTSIFTVYYLYYHSLAFNPTCYNYLTKCLFCVCSLQRPPSSWDILQEVANKVKKCRMKIKSYIQPLEMKLNDKEKNLRKNNKKE